MVGAGAESVDARDFPARPRSHDSQPTARLLRRFRAGKRPSLSSLQIVDLERPVRVLISLMRRKPLWLRSGSILEKHGMATQPFKLFQEDYSRLPEEFVILGSLGTA